MTYWQNESSAAFWRGPSSGIPMRLFQKQRRSSTRVTKANGVSSSRLASPRQLVKNLLRLGVQKTRAAHRCHTGGILEWSRRHIPRGNHTIATPI